MNRRALLIALVVALLGGGLLVAYLRRFEQEASGGEPVEVLIALKPIEGGATITEDMLATRVIPRAYVEDRAVLSSERAKIVGLTMGHTLQAQQTLMWTDLSIAMEDRRSLSSLIQPGMRAVTVRAATTEEQKSLAFLRPGDRVDVIAVLPGEKTTTALVLLQNVLVLSIGLETANYVADKTDPRNASDIFLSLSLNIPEAQLLALAMDKGRISVALRNPDDVRITEGLTELTSAALSDERKRREVQEIRRPIGSNRPVKIDSIPAQP